MPTKHSSGPRGLTAEHRPTAGSCFGLRNREADMGSGDEFSVVVEQDGRGSVVRIIGELDMATAPQLRECLTHLEGTSVTLDFAGVTFMDSGGIAVLACAM